MGCATTLMAAGLDLPDNVKGIIADCGFTSPWDIIKHVAKERFYLPPFPLMYMVDLISEVVAGFGLKEVSIPENHETKQDSSVVYPWRCRRLRSDVDDDQKL